MYCKTFICFLLLFCQIIRIYENYVHSFEYKLVWLLGPSKRFKQDILEESKQMKRFHNFLIKQEEASLHVGTPTYTATSCYTIAFS